MNKFLFPFLAAILLLPASLSAKEVVRLTRFEGEKLIGVSAWFNFEVELIASNETKAVVEIPAELEECLVFEKDPRGVVTVDLHLTDKLKRDLTHNRNDRNYWKENKLVLKLYTPDLRYIYMRGSTQLKGYGQFTCDSVLLEMEDRTKLESLELQAKRLEIKVNNWADAKGLKATAPSVNLQVRDYTNLNMELYENKEVTASLKQSGRLKLVMPENKSLTAKAANKTTLNLSGKSEKADIIASETAKVYAGEFEVKDLSVSSLNSANVTVCATESLKATTSGSGKIQYNGKPAKIELFNLNVKAIE